MNQLTNIAASLLLAVPLLAQRPITFDDMAAIRRVGAPQVSPDGKWIAYDLSTIDMAANVRKSARRREAAMFVSWFMSFPFKR